MSLNLRWYVIHTYSGFEEKTKNALLERIKGSNLLDQFGEIIVPRMTVDKVLKSGKKKRAQKTSFPGYILVQMEISDQTRLLVKNTPKITGFVGNDRAPRPITDQEALRLTNPEEVQEQETKVTQEVMFEKMDRVKVTDGPFTNFDGVVQEVRPERMKLKILVSIFGRETPVELDFAQVTKIEQ